MGSPVVLRRLACVAGLASAVGACSTATPATPGSKVLSVVTTTTQLTDFAREVGGRHVKVYGVLRANVDPHDYEPSPADIDALAKADVIVRNGVGLEKWFEGAVNAAAPKGRAVDASAGIAIRRGDGNEGDPHIWHNPENAAVMAANIETALEKADPGVVDDLKENLAAYQAKLAKLDGDIRAQVGGLANNKVVTNHDAFGYYIDHFGLEFVGSVIPSFDTTAELSAQQIAGIVAKIRSTGTKAVLSESSLPPKTAEAIGREAGVKVVAGEGALYGDTLGPAGSAGDTYLKMEAHNTKVIVDSLR